VKSWYKLPARGSLVDDSSKKLQLLVPKARNLLWGFLML
jgi:hypothetical protein